jgi:hypothetical protein
MSYINLPIISKSLVFTFFLFFQKMRFLNLQIGDLILKNSSKTDNPKNISKIILNYTY